MPLSVDVVGAALQPMLPNDTLGDAPIDAGAATALAMAGSSSSSNDSAGVLREHVHASLMLVQRHQRAFPRFTCWFSAGVRGPAVLPAEQWVALSLLLICVLAMLGMVCYACVLKVKDALGRAIQEQHDQDEAAYSKASQETEKGGTPPFPLSLGVTSLVDKELRAVARNEVASRRGGRENSNLDLGEALQLASEARADAEEERQRAASYRSAEAQAVLANATYQNTSEDLAARNARLRFLSRSRSALSKSLEEAREEHGVEEPERAPQQQLERGHSCAPGAFLRYASSDLSAAWDAHHEEEERSASS